MRLVAYRKIAFLAISVIAIAMIAIGLFVPSSPRIESSNQQGLDNDPYSLTTLESGRTYQMKFRKFKRYGPLFDQFTSSTDKSWDPETAVKTITYTLDSNKQPFDISIETRNGAGDIWFTKSSEDGDSFTVINHRLGIELESEPVIVAPIPDQVSEPLDMVDVFLGNGFEIVEYGSFNGRETTVMRNTAVQFSSEELTPPIQGNYKSPIVHDLDANEYVAEAHIDTERGVVLRSLRYAIDSEGGETLIESFEWLASQEVR